jgi:hypothetical protein
MFVVAGLCGDGDEWLEKNAILRRGELRVGEEKSVVAFRAFLGIFWETIKC